MSDLRFVSVKSRFTSFADLYFWKKTDMYSELNQISFEYSYVKSIMTLMVLHVPPCVATNLLRLVQRFGVKQASKSNFCH